jgi:thioredoxin-like negative regulator of GroEL
VAQVNIAAHPDLAARFKIRAVPTYLIFKGGVPIEFIVGIVPDRFVFETVCKALGLCTETATKKRSKSAARWPWTLGLIPG